ncbi:MFS transporter [Halospeciosus flavus]|uniref:MFS transporter n=1 Tax=Halospeciosus flavus TaxID=3032283 RepID=A0ABD5Z7B3_9EURY|nr:MFS transporter [Halospeciosus flavus]
MHSDERLVRGHSGRLLLVVSLGWLAIQGGRLLLSPLVPEITTDLGVSSFLVGIAFTTMWGIYAFLQYPSGRLSDALSRKTLLLTGLVCCVVGFAALGVAPTYPLFLVGSAVVGLGAGCYPTAARALVSDHFVEKREKAFGLHTGSGDVGGVAAAGVAAAALALATWRTAFVPVVVLLAVVTVAYHRLSREAFVVERSDLAVVATARRLLADPLMRGLLVVYVLYAFTWQSTAAFLPTYLELGKGFDPLVAKVAFALLFAVGAVAKPGAGYVASRLPRKWLIPSALVLGALSLAGVVLASSPLPALVAVGCFAVGLMAYPPMMQSFLMDTFPDDSAGGDLGAMRSVYIGLGALGPTYVGAVASTATYALAFTGLVGCLLVSATLLVYLAD